MKKRSISLLIAVVMLLSMSVSVFAATFTDVADGFWAKTEIEALSKAGVISGYTDKTFKPNAKITKEEAVALFAKALGYNQKENEKIVEFAIEKNAGLFEKYNSYAVNQAAFLLYKGILEEKDIVNYMEAANKGQALKRYEAATLIAKALGADIWLESKPDFDLAYADAKDVPDSAKAYVFYAGEKGIMKGIDETTFAPAGDVTRAQVAVMIYRILANMRFTYTKGLVANVETTLSTLTIKTEEGETLSYNVSKDVPVTINGKAASVKDLDPGLEIVLIRSKSEIFAIDAVKDIPDETIVGIYKGKIVEEGKTEIKIGDIETDDVGTYTLSKNAVITYEGAAGAITSYNVGDFIKVEIKKGEIVVMDAEPKEVLVENLVVEAIEFTPDAVIKFKNDDDEIVSYAVKTGAKLKRNSKEVDFSELSVGDSADVTLTYGEISNIVAIGINKTVSGSLEEITISKTTSYITVNTGSQLMKYVMSRDAVIEIDGEKATIYDLRLGAEVEFKTTSSTVKELTVKSAITSAQITGTITLVNKAYGMIVVSADSGAGDLEEVQIFIKSTAKILDSNDGKVKAIKDLKKGDNIMAAITENTGILEASSVMIIAQ